MGPRYAELHCKTNFSFLEGASHPDELALRAAELGLVALAVTDRNSLAGVVRAHGAAKDLQLRLIIGAEIHLLDAPPVLLWTTDRASYGRLARLITRGRRQAPKGEFRLSFDELAQHAEGLLCGVLPGDVRGAATGRGVLRTLGRYRELFADRGYLTAELTRGADDGTVIARLVDLSRRSRLPLVAAGDVHYHTRGRLGLQDTLTAVRLGMTVAEAGDRLFANAERYLKSPAEMAERFAAAPAAIARTLEIAERSTFSLDELRYEYPEELAPPGETPLQYLTRLTWAGAASAIHRAFPTRCARSWSTSWP